MKRRINLIRKNEKLNLYQKLKINKEQFENCLLPLWIFGEGTNKEIAETLKMPLQNIAKLFNEVHDRGFLNIHPIRSTKLDKHNKTLSTNYILSNSGKEIVRELFLFNRKGSMTDNSNESKNQIRTLSFGSIIEKSLKPKYN